MINSKKDYKFYLEADRMARDYPKKILYISIRYYFALQVILPLVKSYGDSSTLTLSPGRIFI